MSCPVLGGVTVEREVWDKGSSWIISSRQFTSLEISVPLEGQSSSVPSAAPGAARPAMSPCLGTLGAPAPASCTGTWMCERENENVQPTHLHPFPSTARSAGTNPGRTMIHPRAQPGSGMRSSRITGPGSPGHCPLPDVTQFGHWGWEREQPQRWAGSLGQVRRAGATGLGPCRALGSVPMHIPAGWSCRGAITAGILGVWGVVCRKGSETSLKNKRHRPYKSLILKSMKGPESPARTKPWVGEQEQRWPRCSTLQISISSS